jgi:ribokinase
MLPDSLYPDITHLIINETEAAILSGLPRDSISATSDLDSVAADFIKKGVASVIITLGAQGVFYQTVTRLRKQLSGQRLPAAKANVIDTTAAGDTFVGAFAVGILSEHFQTAKCDDIDFDQDELLDESIAFAIRAAGKTVEKAGAQKSIPRFNDVPKAEVSSSYLKV